jgi:hypothetical protein
MSDDDDGDGDDNNRLLFEVLIESLVFCAACSNFRMNEGGPDAHSLLMIHAAAGVSDIPPGLI